MTRNLALDLKPIRVNLVSLGMVLHGPMERCAVTERQAMYKSTAEKVPTAHVNNVCFPLSVLEMAFLTFE